MTDLSGVLLTEKACKLRTSCLYPLTQMSLRVVPAAVRLFEVSFKTTQLFVMVCVIVVVAPLLDLQRSYWGIPSQKQ